MPWALARNCIVHTRYRGRLLYVSLALLLMRRFWLLFVSLVTPVCPAGALLRVFVRMVNPVHECWTRPPCCLVTVIGFFMLPILV